MCVCLSACLFFFFCLFCGIKPQQDTFIQVTLFKSTMLSFIFRLHIFEDGKHNLHLRYADEFNKLVTEFLSN
jgi:pimeloyl-ACP methyl ester carboxylesterase